jgi:hypothetical protein
VAEAHRAASGSAAASVAVCRTAMRGR